MPPRGLGQTGGETGKITQIRGSDSHLAVRPKGRTTSLFPLRRKAVEKRGALSDQKRRIRLCGVAPLRFQNGETWSLSRQRWPLTANGFHMYKCTSRQFGGIGTVRTLLLKPSPTSFPHGCLLCPRRRPKLAAPSELVRLGPEDRPHAGHSLRRSPSQDRPS